MKDSTNDMDFMSYETLMMASEPVGDMVFVPERQMYRREYKAGEIHFAIFYQTSKEWFHSFVRLDVLRCATLAQLRKQVVKALEPKKGWK